MSGQRMGIVSKSEVLVLRRPNSRRNPFIYVRVSVERGEFFIQSQERRCMFRKVRTLTQLVRAANYTAVLY